MAVFCLGVSDRLVDPCLCFPFWEISLGLKLFSWRHSTAGVLNHVHAFSGALLEKVVSLLSRFLFLEFIPRIFKFGRIFPFPFVLLDICLSSRRVFFSRVFRVFNITLFPWPLWIPFFLMVASPFSFSDVSILVGFFFSKGNAFFLRFSFVKEIVSVPSLDVFCLILFKRVQVFCWMEDLHSLKRGV